MFDAKYKKEFLYEGFEKKTKEFYDYFYLNRRHIENCIDTKDKSFLKEFEAELKKVIISKFYSKELYFSFKKIGNLYVFEFYYYHSDYLLSVGTNLFDSPKLNFDNWSFLLKKK